MIDQLKYQVVEVADLRNRTTNYKVFVRGKAGKEPPLVAGIATRELAEAKVAELLAADAAKEKPE